jgi:5-(carboxyamino)imidazole ribonucleotide mutase
MSQRVTVPIVMGSDSDWPVFEPATQLLSEFGVSWEARVLSAHRSPAQVRTYVTQAPRRGAKVFIAGAGGAAHLAGVIAAHTTLPVIGVPIESKALKGLDSLLSMVQMPTGVPVATVAIGNAANAALLAVQILGVADEAVAKKLVAYKRELMAKTLQSDRALQSKIAQAAVAAA